MSHNFESEVSEALGQLLITETDYNVIIHIGEEPNHKEFHAHSNILRCRSEYFNKILSAENIERKDGKYIIKKPNISPQAFDIILKYLYTGKFNITSKAGTELLDFMIISDEMMLKNLTKVTEDFIVGNHKQFLQNDPVGILQIVYYYKSFVNLQEVCLDKICSEPEILFKSDKFTQLSASLLEVILKRDDLNLREIEIWENLIKWGLAQEKTLNKDISKWSKDDVNILKRILYKFIPLIRFYEISTEDYYNKVKPYEKILSKELRDDILKFYMIPGYRPIYTPRKNPKLNIESIIINPNHAALFANWIDKRMELHNNKNIPYEFNLLYRASRDGNTAASFHAKCDNKGATIVVVKVKNSEQIVGGYNPLFWDSSNSLKNTKDSFIFSFANKNSLQSAKVVYSEYGQNSIQCYLQYGPIFGADLHTTYHPTADTWISSVSSYPTLNLPNTFNIDDYEVFQVIKK
ncbi:BTB/POZ domain-containing protein [Rhizophagus clarus]|uniref:BTB/POZ domain-containing protein n=1 Tax=Rhizophagus clarus TaxID=94130 RepID=A0A8H3L8U7_9GLOM|nr:BTB/POZ domain-containing protein [Rhizophagus clarus]